MRQKKKNNLTIISGGQSGVDRSALDFAIQNNIPHKGWCPKNRWAEDGEIPQKYNLKETQETEPIYRTQLNISESDGTLIVFEKEMDKGTCDTLTFCIDSGKTFHQIDLSKKTNKEAFRQWIQNKKIRKLNIAGPRESSNIGIYVKSKKALGELFLD